MGLRILLSSFCFCIFFESLSQNSGTILVLSDENAIVFLDGKKVGETLINAQLQISALVGDHILKAISVNDSLNVETIDVMGVQLESQKVVKFEFKKRAIKTLDVADLKFICPGLESIREFREKNPNQLYYSQPVFYYAFEKGDIISLDLDLNNGVYSCSFFVSKYPENTRVIGSIFLSNWNNYSFIIKERSIYKFTLISDNYYDDGIANLKIRRQPAHIESQNFTTSTTKNKIYKPVEVLAPTSLAFKKEGKNKLAIPIKLPPNTSALFYKYSDTTGKINITGLNEQLIELTKGISVDFSDSLPKILPDKINGEPSNRKCSLYVLDKVNSRLFKKQENSFQSLKTDVSKANIGMVSAINDSLYWMGVQNMEGGNVVMEVAALTIEEEYVISKIQKPAIQEQKTLVLRRKEFIQNLVNGGNIKSNIKLLPIEYQKGYLFY